jgi:formate dehydrogenase subunit delta
VNSERLVYMANQIAGFFAAYPRELAVASVADHIKKFWDPRMRSALIEHARGGGAGLGDVASAAVHELEAHR